MKRMDLKSRKNVLKSMATLYAFMAAICLMIGSCAPTAEDILKKYGAYVETGESGNKAGVTLKVSELDKSMIAMSYSAALIDTVGESVDKLTKRWFVANAEDPSLRFPVQIRMMKTGTAMPGGTQSVRYNHSIAFDNDSINARFLLVGFEGIAPVESKELETQPLFFLVENAGTEIKILTPSPKAAGDLFFANYEPVFFSEQEYAAEIPFEKSKNAVIKTTLSADLKTVTTLVLSVDESTLTPANFNKNRKTSDKKSIFRYLKNSDIRTNIAIETLTSGFRVPARDANGYYIVSDMLLKGGFESTEAIAVIDGKITMTERPVICDLTVTNACIYGTLKLEMGSCGTKQLYVILKNTTTPQDIPENILNNK